MCSEKFVFQFAVRKYNYKHLQKHNFTCCFVDLELGPQHWSKNNLRIATSSALVFRHDTKGSNRAGGKYILQNLVISVYF
jgi:hypothetical protein